ncbi:BspA family leucine-rich repeat surface protein [Enterococcus sp. ALS3]|uniref:BspA family leucine-rich repeat surface protein n=1 Tax=Enterococcus alishanensis TaxID=1303817 RepID=A0ABS6THB7_9ENTE|nr:BspA family leucine-rich repeat surface protein [Enterococcus alishanensis]MBV7392372.1 BspA family leucine-rich repeat surface protein [Enterococcus alishanensis]
MKNIYIIFMPLLLMSLFLFPNVSSAEIQTATWGTAPVSFDSDTGNLTVESGEITPEQTPTVGSVINKESIKSINFVGNVIAPEDSSFLFSRYTYYTNLSSIKGNLDTSYVKNMSSMLNNSNIISADLSQWNTSNVENMSSMFSGSKIKNYSINSWDTSKVTTMRSMFQDSSVNIIDLSNWNISNVTDLGYMFYHSKLTSLNIFNWDTSNVKDYGGMLGFNSTIASLTLGEKSLLSENVVLSDGIISNIIDYTGRWTQRDSNFEKNIYANSSSFMKYYDGSKPGTYERERKAANITINYQDTDGNMLMPSQILTGNIGDAYNTKKIDITGYLFKKVQGLESGEFSENPQMITYLYEKDTSSKLVPIWRAYNLNSGDHLYTTSIDEYSWIVGLKWQAEGIAFQSVLSSYQGSVPIYRLYNQNSGEHFYTISESEYNSVSKKGWNKENIGFYMVPKEEGIPIYRVFNPNATGPGSHLFTESKDEANWLINQGWSNEGVAFYSPK